VSEGKRVPKTPAPRAPMRIVVARRVGRSGSSAVKQPKSCRESLSQQGVNGTPTVPSVLMLGYCAQVAPWGRSALTRTASPTQVEVGDYKMRLRPWQTG